MLSFLPKVIELVTPPEPLFLIPLVSITFFHPSFLFSSSSLLPLLSLNKVLVGTEMINQYKENFQGARVAQ